MADATKDETPSACPVDHKTRAAWLSKNSSSPTSPAPPSPLHPQTTTAQSTPLAKNRRPLSQDREISSIPRALSSSQTSHSIPSNAESTTTSDTKSGNWIYPSERQFFDAMRRKNYSPSASDMPAIIPIHNAVNERAWSQILDWERRSGVDSTPCGGPKLHSFKGLGGGETVDWWAVTPRARWNGLLGYQRPFDRHDWVVERCGGSKVEYVIDFYEGKADRESVRGGKMSFYLDVRPKLNSWEGWRMRVGRFAGFQ
jgi:cytochrome c heme-lyase